MERWYHDTRISKKVVNKIGDTAVSGLSHGIEGIRKAGNFAYKHLDKKGYEEFKQRDPNYTREQERKRLQSIPKKDNTIDPKQAVSDYNTAKKIVIQAINAKQWLKKHVESRTEFEKYGWDDYDADFKSGKNDYCIIVGFSFDEPRNDDEEKFIEKILDRFENTVKSKFSTQLPNYDFSYHEGGASTSYITYAIQRR